MKLQTFNHHYRLSLKISEKIILIAAIIVTTAIIGVIYWWFSTSVYIEPISPLSTDFEPTPALAPTEKPRKRFTNTSTASYYCEGFEGNRTASGSIYHCEDLTFAHKSMKFGTKVKFLYDPDGDGQGNVVTAVCNDRGPFIAGRDFDFSKTVFQRLAPKSKGVIRVRWEVVE